MPSKKQADFDPRLGDVDLDDDVVVTYAGAPNVHGRLEPVLLPASVRRLSGEALDVIRDIQSAARTIDKLRQSLDVLVPEARELGVSWAAIGFSVGLTGEAARVRWNEVSE